jgi:undecaprenyl diphosphate synthase
VTQSNSLHLAVIMDGNGRWAERRGLPRRAGHREGARAVERIVEAAPGLGVGVLTLYAFSSDNWQRPMPEVSTLMGLFRAYLRSERTRAAENGVAVEVIGRRDRLPVGVLAEVAETEAATAAGKRLRLRLAVDYSSRDAILRVAARLAETQEEPSRERFDELLTEVDNGRGKVPPIDLVIRTGGEQRLSDFMLWESAYAELFFRNTMWPDFSGRDLAQIVTEFRGRERRYGAIRPSTARGQLRLTR